MKLILNHSFTRFLLVASINALAGLSSTLLLLNIIGIGYFFSTCVGNTIGTTVSYFLNKIFTFKNKSSIASTAWKFVLVALFSYCFSFSTSYYFFSSSIISPMFPDPKIMENFAVLTGSVLYTMINYCGHRFFTFR